MAMLHIDSGGVAARRTGRGTDLGLEAGQTSDPQNLAAAALDRVVAVAVARVPVVVCKYFSLDANIFRQMQIFFAGFQNIIFMYLCSWEGRHPSWES